MVHMHIHRHIFDWRLVDVRIHMVERLMRELLRRKSMLVVHVERIEVRERLLLHVLLHVRMEPVESSGLMTGIQGAFRSGK